MTSFTPSSFWIPLTLTLVAFAILPSMVLGAGSGSSFLHATGIVLVALGGGMLGLAGFWFVSGARKIPDIAGSALMGFAILAQAYRILMVPSTAIAAAISLLGALGFVIGAGLMARTEAARIRSRASVP